MKLYKFPDVNKETWDGSGLKKRHLKSLADTHLHDEKVKAAKRVIEQISKNLDKAETKAYVLKQELKKAKQQYYQLLEQTDEQHQESDRS